MIKNIIYKIFIKKSLNIKKYFVYYIIFSCLLLAVSAYAVHVNIDNEIKAKIYVELDYPLEGELYFNDIPNQKNLSKVIIDTILSSKKTIDIAMYSFNSIPIVRNLNKAFLDSISINLFLDKINSQKYEKTILGKYIDKFKINQIGIDNIDNGGYMHHKFLLKDKDTRDEELIVGSLNYTAMQEEYDPSFIFNTSDSEIIKVFKNELDFFEKNISGYKKLRSIDYNPFFKKIDYQNGFMEIWLAPGFKKNSVKYRIIDLINNANKKIDIIAWRFNDFDITNALIRKSNQGIKIRIIIDDYYLWSDESTMQSIIYFLKNNDNKNIEIISDLYRTIDLNNEIQLDNFDYFNPYIHQHTMIIDDQTVLTGTNNWTYNGFYRNDEVTFVSDIDFFVKSFIKSFDYHYQDLRNEKANFKIKNSILYTNVGEMGEYKLLIFNEESEKKYKPDPCYESNIKSIRSIFKLDEQCNKINSILYILDKDNKVIYSSYLLF